MADRIRRGCFAATATILGCLVTLTGQAQDTDVPMGLVDDCSDLSNL